MCDLSNDEGLYEALMSHLLCLCILNVSAILETCLLANLLYFPIHFLHCKHVRNPKARGKG